MCWEYQELPPIIETQNLTKHYGSVVALDNVNMSVNEGVTGFLGANGAGKSTAIKIFLGLLKPTSGSVQVLGQNPGDTQSLWARIGYMPEHDVLLPGTSAAAFIVHMAEVSGLPPIEARSRAADTLRHVGLAEERFRPIKDYSLGMRQRVKLAQAIVHDPALILLDEPSAGLDPTGRNEMLDLLSKTHSEFGINILITSHLLGDIQRICDRILVIDSGRIIRDEQVSKYKQDLGIIVIEVSDKLDLLLKSLKNRGVEVIQQTTFIAAIPKATESTHELIRDALVESEAPLRRLSPMQRSLQELFKAEKNEAPVTGE